jgi:hypothetical protein
MTGSISESSIVHATKDQVFSPLGQEAVILHLEAGVYYGLNDVGARIWSLLQAPRSVKEIRETILREYEVEPERCDQDVLALIKSLAVEELIEITHETPH